jgi:hypothetical protein
MPWLIGGVAVAVTLSCLSIPIFIGQRTSPDTGADYIKNYGGRRRGFGPSLKELPGRNKNAWTTLADTIKTRSSETDTIYVWGWYPGIYVRAQRMAPVAKAFYGDMKRHFPNDRPPLELWPIVPQKMFGNEKPRPLQNAPQEVDAYDAAWKQYLSKIDPDEALRYDAMKPFRDFVMNNYRIAGQYGIHLLFEKINTRTPDIK